MLHVACQQPAPLDNLLEHTLHNLYKERDGLMLCAHRFLTGIMMIEFWMCLYAVCHAGWLECDVSYIIMCSLYNAILRTVLTLLQNF